MAIEIIIIISSTATGIAVWGLNKVYNLTHDKISLNVIANKTSNNLIKLSLDVKDMNEKIKQMENDFTEIHLSSAKSSDEMTGLLKGLHNFALKQNNILDEIDKQQKLLGTYGKVIQILSKDYQTRKGK